MTTPNDGTNAKVVINDFGMTQEMQDQAVTIAKKGMSMYTVKTAVAAYIVREMENLHGGNWQCVVARYHLGFCTKASALIDFCVGDTAILLFKAV